MGFVIWFVGGVLQSKYITAKLIYVDYVDYTSLINKYLI